MNSFKLIAYAIRNDQRYWAGIWNDKSIAELILAKGLTSHGEAIIPLYGEDNENLRLDWPQS